MRIRLVGEGVSDIGGEGCLGVVPILTRKVLANKLGADPPWEAETQRLRFHQRKGYPAKAVLAIKEAHREGFDGVAIVVDRDGDKGRLKLLREGRAAAEAEIPIPAVVGVAVEAMEAWLLADEPAIGRALGFEKPPQRGPDPETLDGPRGCGRHPKDCLARHLALDAHEKRNNQARLEAIAEEADVVEIERRCPKGFKPYAEEVRDRFTPLLDQGDGWQGQLFVDSE